jgi:osmotically-inducible protein OsmY
MAIKTMADRQLRETVTRQIEWEPMVKSNDVSVSVTDGVVSLAGFVHTYLERTAAERAAKSVYGVTSIATDIEVRPVHSRTDPEIARDVAEALKLHALVPEGKVKVSVRDGWVTMEGTVEWNYERNTAESVVHAVEGVRGIVNQISVACHVSPSLVKEKIEDALRRSAEVDSKQIKVDAHDTKVVLSGNVRSWLEREEAERAAWAAPGVTNVEDNLVIAL